MAKSRNDILKELLPGLNALFGTQYEKFTTPIGTVKLSDALLSPAHSEQRYAVLSWDGDKWARISDYMSLEEAEALCKVAE